MLTVKHVLDDREFIYPAKSVEFDPKHNPKHYIEDYVPDQRPDYPCQCVLARIERRTQAGGYMTDVLGFLDGVVYVMNDAGKTISRYDLRAGGFTYTSGGLSHIPSTQ